MATYSEIQWTVPQWQASSGSDSMAVWTGLGLGYSASDELVQAGANIYGGRAFFVFELYPLEEGMQVSLNIKPGDVLQVLVSMDTVVNKATFSFYNVTQNTFQQVDRSLGSDGFIGSTAEWVVERPQILDPYTNQPINATMPAFDSVAITDANYSVAGQTDTTAARADQVYIMVSDDGTQDLAVPGPLNDGSFTVKQTGTGSS